MTKLTCFMQADVVERIARDRHDVGELPGGDATQVFVVFEQLGGMHRRGLHGEQRRHARLDHQLELVRILAVGIHARVGSERDLHSGFVGAARGAENQRSDGRRLGGDLRRDSNRELAALCATKSPAMMVGTYQVPCSFMSFMSWSSM